MHSPDRSVAVRWPAKVTEVPKEVFVRPDIFEEEIRRIFHGKEWLAVAHISEVPNQGDFKTVKIGQVPLLITRDMAGEVHVFYNACSHRGNQLETAFSGNRSSFQCPYHRWRFNTHGDLIHTPNKDSIEYAPNFSHDQFPLDKPRMAIVHGIIMVTLHPDTPPIEVSLAGYIDHIAEILGDGVALKLLGYQKLRFKANWKTYRDNDAYHAPLLHTAFRLLNWQGGRGKQFSNDRGHRGYISELSTAKDHGFLKDASLITHKGDGSQTSASLLMFPVFSAIRHLDVITLRFINPLTVNNTEIHFAYFCRESDSKDMMRHRIRQASNFLGPCGMVSMEDIAVFHRLQIGSHTPARAVFQKGVRDEYRISHEFGQNDETSNLPAWEYYRQIMGFEREIA